MPEWLVPITEVLPIDLWLAVALSCAALSAFVALEKKRDPLFWLCWGAATGPIALLALAACPSRPGTAFLLDALVQQFDEPLGKVIVRLDQIERSVLPALERPLGADLSEVENQLERIHSRLEQMHHERLRQLRGTLEQDLL